MSSVDAKRTALLVIDYQNYEVHPEGYWARRLPEVAAQLAASSAVENTAWAVAAARSKDLRVIYVGTAWREGSPDMNVSAPGLASYRDRRRDYHLETKYQRIVRHRTGPPTETVRHRYGCPQRGCHKLCDRGNRF